jgi:hypothetical protein
MGILTVESPVVKPYVTIERHKSGAWQPFYVDSRGKQVLRISVRVNNRPSVEWATRYYAENKGIEYHEPESKPVMIVLCSWCNAKGKKTVVSIKPCLPHQVGEDYGGICPECAAEKEAELRADGAPDDLVESFVVWAGGGVSYSHGAGEIDEGTMERTDWRG